MKYKQSQNLSRKIKLKFFQNLKIPILILFVYVIHGLAYALTIYLRYTDTDQLIVADMAIFYSKGQFPEPLFFGQNYLLPLESWLAVPLIILGIRADIAVLLISLIGFYLPFYLATLITFLSNNKKISILIAIIPIISLPEIVVISSIPRTFGLSSSLISILFILHLISKNRKQKTFYVFFIGSITAASPTNLLFLPFLFLLAAKHNELITKYLIPFSVGFISIFSLTIFYSIFPEYLAYDPGDSSFSISNFLNSTANIEILFYPIASSFFIAFCVLIIYNELSKDNRKKLWISLILMLMIILLFLSNSRIFTFIDSPFYSGFRFWLPLTFIPPILFVWFTVREKSRNSSNEYKFFPKTFLSVSLLIGLLAISTSYRTFIETETPTGIKKREEISTECKEIFNVEPSSLNYIVLDNYNPWLMYGCQTFTNQLATFPKLDRRTWIIDFALEQQYQRINLP